MEMRGSEGETWMRAQSQPGGQRPGLPEEKKQEDGVDQRQLEDLIAPLCRPARLPPSQICISI